MYLQPKFRVQLKHFTEIIALQARLPQIAPHLFSSNSTFNSPKKWPVYFC